MCPRREEQRHYDMACVLGLCANCGFDRKVAGQCPVETERQQCWVSTRQHVNVDVVDGKGKKKKVLQEGTKSQFFLDFMNETRAFTGEFLKHDFLAR